MEQMAFLACNSGAGVQKFWEPLLKQDSCANLSLAQEAAVAAFFLWGLNMGCGGYIDMKLSSQKPTALMY